MYNPFFKEIVNFDYYDLRNKWCDDKMMNIDF